MEAFPKIFLVTQDSVLADAIPAQLAHALQAECPVFASWEAAADAIAHQPPSLLVLDETLPHPPELAQFRRDYPLIALLLLGNQPEAEAQSDALPLFAYVPRPISLPALVRSLEHLAYARQITAGQQRLKLTESSHFLPHKKWIESDKDQQISLTDKEVALLLCLYHHRQEKLPRDYLLEEVWGYSQGVATHTLETHLYRLRQKLKEATGLDSLIRTEQGTYQLFLS